MTSAAIGATGAATLDSATSIGPWVVCRRTIVDWANTGRLTEQKMRRAMTRPDVKQLRMGNKLQV